jgi:hypothetical protein
MTETLDVFCTNYGMVRMGPDVVRRVAHVRRTKDGDMDRRFKAARHIARVLTAWSRRIYLRDND